jgi:hypothetical protein
MESFQPREEIASFQHFPPRKFPRKTTDRGDKHRKVNPQSYASTQKQRITTKSSKLVCAFDAAIETIGLRNYLLSRGHQVNPSILGQDNLSTKLILEKGPRVTRRIKHLNIRYFFVQNYIQKQMIVKYVNTNDMIADI